jgi:release factor glutamine methyltransferase
VERPATGRQTVGDALDAAAARLAAAGVPASRLEAELLLGHLLDRDRGWLFAHRREPLDDAVAARYAAGVGRRSRREPLQHVTGVQEFYGLSIEVDGRVLIPRPETEGLVHAVLALDPPRGGRIVDLGTGSGCIAIALAVARADLAVLALDRSEAALGLARRNAARHGVADRIRFEAGDLGRPPTAWRRGCDAVVSNPPYVDEAAWAVLAPEVRDHDPREALVAGPTGLEAYQALAGPAFDLLRPGGFLALELGSGQARAVAAILAQAGFAELDVRRDLAGIERVLTARRREG